MIFDPGYLLIVVTVGIAVLLMSGLLKFILGSLVERHLARRDARRAKKIRNPPMP